MNQSPPSWVGRTLNGRYTIEARLGHGGMSTVYKAQDPNLQRTVAVKIIHPHLSEDPEFVKRFEQEAAAVAKLRHPNIMQVHDFNHDSGTYYIIFEYIAGQPLNDKLKALNDAHIRMPLHDALAIMIPLCEAVAYAHGRNMIHRDLKPSNVIIDLLNQPILLDFGIAKIVGGDHVHTATGATVGTASYMAPEQVLGNEIDRRADIYSLGIILYEMAAGEPPYKGNSPLTVMMQHVNEPLPDITYFNANLPANFTHILDKSLAKNPADRFWLGLRNGPGFA
ncbi:MAG: serine/threonine protein kinase [Anaerolineae bacterium]|nr:serine/threonine protein kinase [Anaerolineae bacterium]